MSKEENIKKVMKKYKDFEPTTDQIDKIEEMVDNYSDKSEDDIFFEIIRVKDELEKDMSKEEYEEIFNKLDSIRPLLNDQQLEKLDKLLSMLEDE